MSDHDIQRGDIVFLHDYKLGEIFGPFTVETDGLETIDEDAWENHRYNFSKQIRVSHDDPIYRIDTNDLTGLDRISDDDIFYDLTIQDGERLLTQLRENGVPTLIHDDGTTSEVTIDDEEVEDLSDDRTIWQITPGSPENLWSEWSEHHIASLGHTLGIDLEESREERLESVANYDGSRHTTREYQAYLFQEQVDKDDVVVAKRIVDGEARIYGIGRVIVPYDPNFPSKLRQDHESHDHQIGVAWIPIRDTGLPVSVDVEKIASHDFAHLDTRTFTLIERELKEGGELGITELVDKFGIETESQSTISTIETGVEIPDSPDDIDLSHLVFTDMQTLVSRILSALRTGKHVILTGPPGTGKTELAESIAKICSAQSYRTVTATADWSTFDTIGGYRPGTTGELEFVPGIFLEAFAGGGSPESSRWLVIDEINRADIDKAFGALFTALTGKTVTLPFQNEGSRIVIDGNPVDGTEVSPTRYAIPDDWRLLATMNTYDKTSLYDLSYAFMRRFAFVSVPTPTSDEIDIGLVQRYVDVWDDVDDTGEYYRGVAEIWSVVNEDETRQIGPAIVEDILQFLQETDGDYTGAITMYVLPQFEGLRTRQQVRIVQDLVRLDTPTIDEEEIKTSAREYFELTEDDYDRFGE